MEAPRTNPPGSVVVLAIVGGVLAFGVLLAALAVVSAIGDLLAGAQGTGNPLFLAAAFWAGSAAAIGLLLLLPVALHGLLAIALLTGKGWVRLANLALALLGLVAFVAGALQNALTLLHVTWVGQSLLQLTLLPRRRVAAFFRQPRPTPPAPEPSRTP